MKLITRIGAIMAIAVASAFPASAQEARGTLGQILDAGKLNIMNNLAAPPWQFRDANGNPAGISVDLTRMIAAKLDVDVQLTDADWAALIPGLLANKSDILATSMTVTNKRAQQVLFTSEAWYQTGSVIAVKPDAKTGSWEALNDPAKKLAVVGGSSNVDVAKKFFPNAEAQSYPTDVDVYQALETGRVDAIIIDKAVMNVVTAKYGFVTKAEPRELVTSDNWSLTVRPGDDFTWQYLNLFLAQAKQNGELDALVKYWVDGAQWQKDFSEKNDGVSKERLDLVNFLGIQAYTPETQGTRMTLQ